MSTKMGWLVRESTTRDGCDLHGDPQQFWGRRDAEAAAEELRAAHADDECYRVTVERETAEDAAHYRNYV